MFPEPESAPEPAPEFEVRRALPRGDLVPDFPGYDIDSALVPDPAPGVRRWRGRRQVDALEVTVTCVEALPTEEAHATAVERVASLSQVRHPHLERVRDVVIRPHRPRESIGLALVTSALHGQALEEVLRLRGPLSPGQAVSVLCPVAEALEHLHDHHHVHGALCAGSVHLNRNGMPLLTDIGLHGCAGRPHPLRIRQGYVAPEVAQGFAATQQSDGFALAALVWHVLSGRPPGEDDGTPALDGERPGSGELSPQVVQMLAQGLGSDPEERPTVSEWLAALPQLGSPAPVDVVIDMAEEVPRRLRTWAAQPLTVTGSRGHLDPRHRAPRHRGRQHRAVRHGARQNSRGRRGARGEGPSVTALTVHDAPSTQRGRLGLAVLAVLVVGVVGWGLLRSWGALALGSEADSGPPAASTAAPTPHESGRPAQDRSRASPAHQVVQSVLRARAGAWESAVPADLERAAVKGSAAWRSDRDDLAEARRRGIDFEEVRFRVLRADVVSSQPTVGTDAHPGGMVVRATVRREPVLVRTADGERHRYPGSTETVLLTLRRADAGWRLYDWD